MFQIYRTIKDIAKDKNVSITTINNRVSRKIVVKVIKDLHGKKTNKRWYDCVWYVVVADALKKLTSFL